MATMTDAELEEAAIREYADDVCYGDMDDARVYWANKWDAEKAIYYRSAARRIPEGSVVVDRARFERLRAAADAASRVTLYSSGRGHEAHMNDSRWCVLPPDWMDVMCALQPGDRDPLS